MRDEPKSHDGENAFKLNVEFSGAPSGLSPKRDAASVLEVEGGTVTAAKAETRHADSPWEVTVEPEGDGDVTVRIPVRDCGEPGAVCIGGQPLAEAAEVTVPGPDTVPVVTTASPIEAAENSTVVATLAATDGDTPVEDLAWSIPHGGPVGTTGRSSR